jgi:hypothetical protein
MKLATYLTANEIRSAAFGRLVGVSKQTMFKYVRGICFPPPETLKRIREATQGAVTADDFVDQHVPGDVSASASAP